jgi:hypothetical protein
VPDRHPAETSSCYPEHTKLRHRSTACALLLVATSDKLAGAVPSAPETCLGVMAIDSAENDARVLRTELGKGGLASLPAAECADVHLTLVLHGNGWRVTLERAGRRVERDVESVSLAAVWVESWLAPGFTPAAPPSGSATERSSPRSASSPSGPPPSGEAPRAPLPALPSGSLALFGTGALSEDGGRWLGGALSVQLHATQLIWFGAELGADFDPATRSRATGRVLEAAAIGGVRWPMTRNADLLLGAGAGIDSASVRLRTAQGLQTETEGGPYLALNADLRWRLGNIFAITTGVGVAAFPPIDADPRSDTSSLPSAAPWMMAKLRIGVAACFSRQP